MLLLSWDPQKADYKFNWKNWSKISNEAKDIVKGMLTLDPKRRLSAGHYVLITYIPPLHFIIYSLDYDGVL